MIMLAEVQAGTALPGAVCRLVAARESVVGLLRPTPTRHPVHYGQCDRHDDAFGKRRSSHGTATPRLRRETPRRPAWLGALDCLAGCRLGRPVECRRRAG